MSQSLDLVLDSKSKSKSSGLMLTSYLSIAPISTYMLTRLRCLYLDEAFTLTKIGISSNLCESASAASLLIGISSNLCESFAASLFIGSNLYEFAFDISHCNLASAATTSLLIGSNLYESAIVVFHLSETRVRVVRDFPFAALQ